MGTGHKENGSRTHAGDTGLRTRTHAHGPTHPARVLAGAAPITRVHGAKYLGLTRHMYLPGLWARYSTLVKAFSKFPGVLGFSFTDPKFPGVLGFSFTDPKFPGVLGFSFIDPKFPGVLGFSFTDPKIPGSWPLSQTLAITNTLSEISQGAIKKTTLAVINILGASWNDLRIQSQKYLLDAFADAWTRAQSSLRPSGSTRLMKSDKR